MEWRSVHVEKEKEVFVENIVHSDLMEQIFVQKFPIHPHLKISSLYPRQIKDVRKTHHKHTPNFY